VKPTYRLLREGEEPQLFDLMQAAFGRWPTIDVGVPPLDHLRWKLRPPNAEHYHCVAELDGRLIASQICILFPLIVNQRRMVGMRGMDATVRPEFQGQGVMRELRMFKQEGLIARCDFEFGGFARHPAMLKLHEQDGRIRLGGGMETLIAPLSVGSAVTVLKVRPGRSPAELARSAASFAQWMMSRRVRQGRRHLVTIRDVERFDERVDAFGAEAAEPFEFILERTQAYLNWRYADPRAGDFAIKLAEEEGQMVGYAVLRRTNGRAHLADMMALPGRDDVVEALALAALEHFREAGESTVQFLMPKNHPYEQTLRRCGFAGKRKRKVPPDFLPMRLSEDELASLTKPDLRFHFMLGDSDTI